MITLILSGHPKNRWKKISVAFPKIHDINGSSIHHYWCHYIFCNIQPFAQNPFHKEKTKKPNLDSHHPVSQLASLPARLPFIHFHLTSLQFDHYVTCGSEIKKVHHHPLSLRGNWNSGVCTYVCMYACVCARLRYPLYGWCKIHSAFCIEFENTVFSSFLILAKQVWSVQPKGPWKKGYKLNENHAAGKGKKNKTVKRKPKKKKKQKLKKEKPKCFEFCCVCICVAGGNWVPQALSSSTGRLSPTGLISMHEVSHYHLPKLCKFVMSRFGYGISVLLCSLSPQRLCVGFKFSFFFLFISTISYLAFEAHASAKCYDLSVCVCG